MDDLHPSRYDIWEGMFTENMYMEFVNQVIIKKNNECGQRKTYVAMADRLTIAMQKVGHYLLCGWREVKI